MNEQAIKRLKGCVRSVLRECVEHPIKGGNIQTSATGGAPAK